MGRFYTSLIAHNMITNQNEDIGHKDFGKTERCTESYAAFEPSISSSDPGCDCTISPFKCLFLSKRPDRRLGLVSD